MMGSFLKNALFLLLTAVPLFAQSGPTIDREQALVTGETFWRQALGGAVMSLPDVQAQSAVVVLDGGNVMAFSSAGTPLWNYSAGGRLGPFVSRSREGTSYLSRTNGALIAVSRSGREIWRRFPGAPLSGRVITGWDGRLFVPTEKKISCYTVSGNLLWSRAFETGFSLAPQLDKGGGIMLALDNDEACRIDPFGNIQKIPLKSKPAVLVSVVFPAISAGASGPNAVRIIAFYKDGTMEIPGQGAADSRPLPKLPSSPLAAVSRGNEIAAVSSDGRVTLFSLNEGDILWNGDSHIREVIKSSGKAELEAEMFFDERGIYILSKDGATGFTRDGRRLWFTVLKNTAAIPAFGDDGVLYSGGQDWILYTYKMEDRILPVKRNLYGPVPEGSYGTSSPISSFSIEFPAREYEIKAALDQISAGIRTGNVGTNELAWISWLMTIAGGEFPAQHRVAALRLLGRIGSQETISWLTALFRRETDSLVKSSAAAAIGAIGIDPEGGAIRTFLDTVIFAGNLQDEQVLAAIASATGALCRFSGPPLSDTGVKILGILSGYTQPAVVRRLAQRELAQLRAHLRE